MDPSIVELDLDQLNPLSKEVIEEAVQAMLHDPEVFRRFESRNFVQFLLHMSTEPIHDRVSQFLGLPDDLWKHTVPGISFDALVQSKIFRTPTSETASPSPSFALADYLWATVSNRDDFD
jgi:hypothetical protein